MQSRFYGSAILIITVAAMAGLHVQSVPAANIMVTNTVLKSRMYAGKVAYVQFD